MATPASGDTERTLATPVHAGGMPLPDGYVMHEFRIERVIGEGGFGIVYLARDEQLQRTVALKEYMPSSLASRQSDLSVSVRSERHRETFELGRRSFVNEARLLASFDHPSLLKVYRFWEQNGTAYMAMPFYDGPTLKAWLGAQPHPPDEAWLKQLLWPLLEALELLHADHCYHRDIAPDNILLLGSRQRPVLLDFGAARRVIGDATQALTTILKPGYAPIEQYAEMPMLKQGAWTDVYALCAVLYAAITGHAPMPSVARMVSDELVPLSKRAHGRYSPGFLEAIDKGLSVRPEQRPPDIAALRRSLYGAGSSGHAEDDDVTRPGAVDDEATVVMPHGVHAHAAQIHHWGTASTPAPPPPAETATGKDFVADGASSATASAPVSTGRSLKPIALLAAAIAGLGGVGFVVWHFTQDTPPSVAVSAPAPPPPASAPAPIASPTPTRGPFSVVAALDDIVRRALPSIVVNAWTDKGQLVIGQDRLQFRVKSSEPGYLYVFLGGTDQSHLWMLFPNAIDADNRIAAGTELTLPRKGWQITAGGPAGTNHIVTMVSREPRDFTAAGLKKGDTIPEFDLAAAERLWVSAPSTMAALQGEMRCAATPCDEGFGAAMVSVDEMQSIK
jgi:serine/threonine protein kinase